jgi:hypothetical protein
MNKLFAIQLTNNRFPFELPHLWLVLESYHVRQLQISTVRHFIFEGENYYFVLKGRIPVSTFNTEWY